MSNPDEVLGYWLDEIGPKGWYGGGEALDAEIRERFGTLWERAMDGSLALWLTYPSGTLAYIILTDQFSRNMFRGTARAFSSDILALAASKMAIAKGWDTRIDEPARQFFYMPLVHAECLPDQDRAVRLIQARMPQQGDQNLLHAKAHREVIRQFGRFPTRNAALGRAHQPGEASWLDEGGYGKTIEALKAAAA